jgi:hypothetical protein
MKLIATLGKCLMIWFFDYIGRGRNSLPISDSKERGGQGQRAGAVILWIREAGIAHNGKSKSEVLIFGISAEIFAIFPQPERRIWSSSWFRHLDHVPHDVKNLLQ